MMQMNCLIEPYYRIAKPFPADRREYFRERHAKQQASEEYRGKRILAMQSWRERQRSENATNETRGSAIIRPGNKAAA